MTAHSASLINALSLIVLSVWAYGSSDTPSITALIPAAFGALLVACNPGVKAQNKVIAHVAVLLTALVSVALIVPLRGAFGRGDIVAIMRVGLMWASSLMAMVYFVKSFIDARKRRG